MTEPLNPCKKTCSSKKSNEPSMPYNKQIPKTIKQDVTEFNKKYLIVPSKEAKLDINRPPIIYKTKFIPSNEIYNIKKS